jgi:hypothetical protein
MRQGAAGWKRLFMYTVIYTTTMVVPKIGRCDPKPPIQLVKRI